MLTEQINQLHIISLHNIPPRLVYTLPFTSSSSFSCLYINEYFQYERKIKVKFEDATFRYRYKCNFFLLYCSNALLTKQTMCAYKVCLIHYYTRHFPTESNAHTNLNINFFAYCFNEQKVHSSFDVIS